MAQTILLSSPSLPSFNPPSPDPTPLRMLAFSVAEAALGDPNSPMTPDMSRVPTSPEEWKEDMSKSRLARWCADVPLAAPGVKETIASRRGQPLWDVVERAKERREKEKSSPSTIDSPLPTSPDSYSFVLPSNSYLAASLTTTTVSNAADKPSLSRKHFPFPLYTRSADPSPTKSTFSALDQTRPPPEFMPKPRRLAAADFASAVPTPSLPSPTQRLQAQAVTRLNYPSPSRHTAKTKLPSLAEIQRKLRTGAGPGAVGHRRTGSGGQLEQVQAPLRRSDSTSSDEMMIKTPEEELKTLALDDVIIRRSVTPPHHAGGAESRLAPFLRQRTSGRLVAGSGEKIKARPATMPPISLDEDPISVFAPSVTLTVTPPSASIAVAEPSVPPPSARRPGAGFSFTTPPRTAVRSASGPSPSPASPTDSARSSSPTLSIPIITCTPAQQADSDSDSDSSDNDVVVFDGESEKVERSRRGQEMKDRLLLARRRSLH